MIVVFYSKIWKLKLTTKVTSEVKPSVKFSRPVSIVYVDKSIPIPVVTTQTTSTEKTSSQTDSVPGSQAKTSTTKQATATEKTSPQTHSVPGSQAKTSTTKQATSTERTSSQTDSVTGSQAKTSTTKQATSTERTSPQTDSVTKQIKSTKKTTSVFRLEGSNSDIEGRLEINRATWRTICGLYFGSRQAAVACNSLGFGYVYLYELVWVCL